MQYLLHHLEALLDSYDGTLPLHHYLKQYFKAHKRLGSRDRRGLSDAIYAWYRVGKSIEVTCSDSPSLPLAALFLCGLQPKAFQGILVATWGDMPKSLPERIAALHRTEIHVDLEKLLPESISFSHGIDRHDWLQSLLQQPKLFLRIRGTRIAFQNTLTHAAIPHEWLSSHCVAVPNGTDVGALFKESSYVVQDASSQETGKFFQHDGAGIVWDCCAGAGGKSLLFQENFPKANLLATDIRKSILENLKKRFALYSLKTPKTLVLDASNPIALAQQLGTQKFDTILCDVPCSGSGTWARTPESCHFFKEESLKNFQARQQQILGNVFDFLKPGGRIYYITCSVFAAENEEVLQAVAVEKQFQIQSAQLINGIDKQADCLFIAVLVNSGTN
ncbi:MAG: methyltransferase domain-containing protein [Bacteroidetes bacterium]|nr:methyltransferase domain-containing protein [Bacteroidota bacterium]